MLEQLQLELNLFKSSVVFSILDLVMADWKTRFASCKQICGLFSPVLAFIDLEKDENDKTINLVSKYLLDLADSNSVFEDILHMKDVYSTVFLLEKYSKKLLNSTCKLSS